jgi:hypothetical protein
MSAVPDDLFDGLKKDVEAHSAAQANPPPPTTASDVAASGDDLFSGLKADVENHLAGGDQTGAGPAPPKKQQVALSSLPYVDKVARAESGGDPNAKAPGSSATGLGQFINSTWVPLVRKHRPDLAGQTDQQLLAMRNDPDLNRQMISAYAQDNQAKLKNAGIPVNDASTYGAHWFGPDTFQKIYNASPDTPIENIVGAGPAKNNGIAGMTAAQVKTRAANKMGLTVMPQSLSWDDTLQQAGQNFLPSLGEEAKGVIKAIGHPIDTASTLAQVGKGLYSKVMGWAGDTQDPKQKESDEALVDALGHSYAQKYGSIDGFQNALANNPADILMDASTLLSGGGALAAKAPGIAGTVGKIASAAGTATNPLAWAGSAVKAATAPAKVLDASGNVVPKVDSLIKKVTGGTMSAKDLVDPDVKAAFAQTLTNKGISDASVREAILTSQGLKAPTSVVNKTAPAVGGREATQSAIDANNEALTKRGASIAPPPAGPDIAAALDNAHTASYNQAAGQYEKIRQMPGTFGSSMPDMPQLGTKIRNAFANSGIPGQDLSTLRQTGHTQAANAISLLGNTWGAGKTLNKAGDFNAQEVLSMQKALSGFRQAATGSDLKATSQISNAFDQHIAGLSAKGLFKDPATSRAIPGLGQQIKAANQAYRAHFQNFEEPNGANNSIVSAVRKLKSGQARGLNGTLMSSQDTDLYTQAQASLNRDLMNPAKGASTYNQISKLLGGNTVPIDSYIKGTLLGDSAPKNAAAMLGDKNSVAAKAFASSPDDLSRARHLQAADAINNAKPDLGAKAGSLAKNMLGRAGLKGAFIAGGEHLGGPLGALIGSSVLEPIAEHFSEMRAAQAATKGAAPTSGFLAKTAKAAARGVTGKRGITTAHYANEAEQPQNAVVARASGGKVDTDMLVERLIKRWKHAKKATDETTKPLLHVPDNTIIKALDIAQEHI